MPVPASPALYKACDFPGGPDNEYVVTELIFNQAHRVAKLIPDELDDKVQLKLQGWAKDVWLRRKPTAHQCLFVYKDSAREALLTIDPGIVWSSKQPK